MDPKKVMICRCSDVTLDDLNRLFDQGYETFEDLKRIRRIGMGPCQAQTCGKMVQWEISKRFKLPLEEVRTHTTRPLTTGVKLNVIAQGSDDEKPR
jgi:bacterioferritin-associated ferredoxin